MATVIPAALLLPWLAGRHWRGRRELVRDGWRLAQSLEERQHLVAERARLAERADIAADMHDSLGHVLGLVALRAGALELSPDLTGRDRADVAELRSTIADAVEQLRQTVAVLHDSPKAETGATTREGGPSVKDTVADLIGRAAASGVPVSWEQRGAVPVLPPLVERRMYRVVQEALTNAVKHAPGRAIRVGIDHATDHTRVSVVNAAQRGDGPAGQTAGRAVAAGGRGLTGLRERVTVLGGTLHTGPHHGGFQVTAVLPHQAAARPRTRPTATGSGGHTDHRTAPEHAERLAAVRRAARRRTAAALAAPVAAAAFFLPAAAYLAWRLTTGVLPPSRYDVLEPGRTRTELGPLLPARAPHPGRRMPPAGSTLSWPITPWMHIANDPSDGQLHSPSQDGPGALVRTGAAARGTSGPARGGTGRPGRTAITARTAESAFRSGETGIANRII
ncbi:sensor histidine kinase [Streptomyces yangpuensis]|uniref:ATP-binding protein n=1 Tax=Streptomyces yangpuensis TaxID=1648182 RepID=UPI00381EDCE7